MKPFRPPSDEVVLRIVYDGPGQSGKTTSLRTLARELGQTVNTPEERDGRTLFFDWMEYVGGKFDGGPIRTQVLTVPGQREFAARRETILASADAVICVTGSSKDEVEAGRLHLEDLQSILQNRGDPPVGIVVQANKRDLPDAVDRSDLLAAFDDRSEIVPVETVATTGKGIRHTFVLAVRLALDRLLESRVLSESRPWVRTGTPNQLLAALRALDEGTETVSAVPDLPSLAVDTAPTVAAAPSPPRPRARAPHTDDRAEDCILPGSDIAPGMVWPPVQGRIVLEKANGARLLPERQSNGDWRGLLEDRWEAHSGRSAVFSDLEEARRHLLTWARHHAACYSFLSPSRCLALSPTKDGRWRLWQVIRRMPNLRGELRRALDRSPEDATVGLLTTAWALQEATERFCVATELIPLSLDTVTLLRGQPAYGALFRNPDERVEGTWESMDRGLTLLTKELRSELRNHYGENPSNAIPIVNQLGHLSRHSPDHKVLAKQVLHVVANSLSS